jgi:ADP-L-glycero-D-manno-heptose 6-epimerase
MSHKNEKYVVVTGAAGFIGSGVVQHLNDKGITNIVVVDDLDNGPKWKNLVKKKFSEWFSQENFIPWLEMYAEDVSAIIHLGACSDTTESDAQYLLDNNYRYSIALAEIALQHDIRFIYASSAATYGDGSQGFSDAHDKLETLEPLNMYGYSKHLFDLWLKNRDALDKVVGLKYFNVYGPNEHHKGRMASAITKMVPSLLSKGCIQLFKTTEPERFGDGEQCRDFIYVKDAVALTCAFLDNDAGGIFNIGMGVPSTWNQLSHAVIHALRLPSARIEYIDMPEDLRDKYQNYTCAEMKKIQETFPDFTMHTLDEAVKEYVQEYILRGALW